MRKLGDDTLRSCSEAGNAIALVRVSSVGITAPGSRSEHVKAELVVERVICGDLPSTVTAWSFTSKGDTLVAAGRRYVIAVIAAQGYTPFGIGDFVEVPEGRDEEAVHLHLQALERLKKAKQ